MNLTCAGSRRHLSATIRREANLRLINCSHVLLSDNQRRFGDSLNLCDIEGEFARQSVNPADIGANPRDLD
jgi:hypothetical protein